MAQGKVATDNTTVVAYINKEGGMRSGSLCALLWRLLCWCSLRHVVLKARHIPGHLNVIADKSSRQAQIIQMEWSLHQEVFDLLCQTWHHPQVDMFATRHNYKLSKFVSLVPDPNAWAVDTNSLLGELGHVCLSPRVDTRQNGQQTSRSSVQESDPDSSGLAQHAVLLGSGGSILPDTPVSTQSSRSGDPAFQQGCHRDLTNLNLHTWLLGATVLWPSGVTN